MYCSSLQKQVPVLSQEKELFDYYSKYAITNWECIVTRTKNEKRNFLSDKVTVTSFFSHWIV